MRAHRAGRRARVRTLYVLNVAEYRRAKRASIAVISDLAGLSRYTIDSIIHPRGKGLRGRTTRRTGEALAEAMRIPFERLFHEFRDAY